MSFADSRSLALDRQPRTESTLIVFTSIVAAGIPWLASLGTITVFVSVSAMLAVLVSWYAAGSIGKRSRIVQAQWDGEGQWWLVDATGGRFAVTLDPSTRIFSAVAWLRWRGEHGRRQFVLWRAVAAPDVNRRLSARLRQGKLQSESVARHSSANAS